MSEANPLHPRRLADFANGPNGDVYALAWNDADPQGAADCFAGNYTAKLDVAALTGGGEYSHAMTIDDAPHWFVAAAD